MEPFNTKKLQVQQSIAIITIAMPNLKSNQKRLRQAIKKTAVNKAWKNRVKKSIKSFTLAPTPEALSILHKQIDKAAKVGVFHPNKAARLKSRTARFDA